jgi:L-ribulokinase
VVALDWLNGNRSVLMNANLGGMLLGLTLSTLPEHVYRALVEATAFGTKIIVESYRSNGVSVTELMVCGGLAKDPLILQVYADVMELPVRVAASGQAVALGAAIFGALAAGGKGGGFDDVQAAVKKMTRRPRKRYDPNPAHQAAYRELFDIYQQCHDEFGRNVPDRMARLKKLNTRTG